MLNKVQLIGNVGQEPEIRTMQSGDKVCSMRIATSRKWKDNDTGEKKEKTEWHNVVIFNKGLVSVCENYVKKGMRLYIEGELETRKWQDHDGKDRYTTEVILRGYSSSLSMLSDKRDTTPHGTGITHQEDFGDEIPF